MIFAKIIWAYVTHHVDFVMSAAYRHSIYINLCRKRNTGSNRRQVPNSTLILEQKFQLKSVELYDKFGLENVARIRNASI